MATKPKTEQPDDTPDLVARIDALRHDVDRLSRQVFGPDYAPQVIGNIADIDPVDAIVEDTDTVVVTPNE